MLISLVQGLLSNSYKKALYTEKEFEFLKQKNLALTTELSEELVTELQASSFASLICNIENIGNLLAKFSLQSSTCNDFKALIKELDFHIKNISDELHTLSDSDPTTSIKYGANYSYRAPKPYINKVKFYGNETAASILSSDIKNLRNLISLEIVKAKDSNQLLVLFSASKKLDVCMEPINIFSLCKLRTPPQELLI